MAEKTPRSDSRNQQESINGSVLIIPLIECGRGSGHLRRCIQIQKDLGSAAKIYIPEEIWQNRTKSGSVLRSCGEQIPGESVVTLLKPDDQWQIIIFDKKETSLVEYFRLSQNGLCIGIDEGGDARKYMPFLLDTLPKIPELGEANIASTTFLNIPIKAPGESLYFGKILLTFGGEDPEGLTGKFARFLIQEKIFLANEITLVKPPAALFWDPPAGTTVLEKPTGLQDVLSDYDLIFTSFGMTAYEAVCSGRPVILLNPSPYHERLSEISGFPSIGVKIPSYKLLIEYLGHPKWLRERCASIAPNRQLKISDQLLKMRFPEQRNCPLCGYTDNTAEARFHDRTFYACSACGMTYQLNYEQKEIEYSREYFFENYEAQYGRTYLEDFSHISGLAKKRISAIRKLENKSAGKQLLDIGCAYGPFLYAAQKEGYEPHGLDVSPGAVEYVQSTLGFNAMCYDFLDMPLEKLIENGMYDVVTMWFVIEHFKHLGDVLDKVNRILKPGGIFAFSTPSFSGISAMRGRREFLRRSPSDHYTIWKPEFTAGFLERHGFKLEKIRITGHHPERFSLLRGKKSGLLYNIVALYSRIFGKGDTFEAYVRKRGGFGER